MTPDTQGITLVVQVVLLLLRGGWTWAALGAKKGEVFFHILIEATKLRHRETHPAILQLAKRQHRGTLENGLVNLFQNRNVWRQRDKVHSPAHHDTAKTNGDRAHEISPCPVSLPLSEYESVALGEEAASDPYSSTSTSARDVITR